VMIVEECEGRFEVALSPASFSSLAPLCPTGEECGYGAQRNQGLFVDNGNGLAWFPLPSAASRIDASAHHGGKCRNPRGRRGPSPRARSAEKVLAFDSSAETRALIQEHADRAGHPELALAFGGSVEIRALIRTGRSPSLRLSPLGGEGFRSAKSVLSRTTSAEVGARKDLAALALPELACGIQVLLGFGEAACFSKTDRKA
jgi:hypothetical protein